ncbi:hypothetical protein [Paraburkholderia sp. BCC1884]|uniref:hypothetical protein n=1 Tax=Paraburkholderia sp. BCC1884 TaxID=2562668 RepID=UPI00118342AA|nr:hypothetical protein [Paraburkholderia sp. BCC1884]
MEAIFRRWRAEVGLRDDGQEFEDDEDARTPRLFSRLDNQIEHLFFLSVRSMLWSSQRPALSKMAINLLTHESLVIPKQLKVCGESSQLPASDAVSQMVHALIGKSVRRSPGKTKPSIKWVPGVWRQSRLTCRSISGRLLKVSG